MKSANVLFGRLNFSIGVAAAVLVSIVGTLAISQWGAPVPSNGPGMIVTYVSTIQGVRIYMDSSRLPGGKDFPNAGSFGYAKDPLAGGATEGAAPDGRHLPEYVDFSWQERKYPAPEQDSTLSIAEANAEMLAEFKSLPIKAQRVLIRSRVPQEVVDQVMESNRQKKPGKLAEKALWIYFVWTEQGIKLHWRLWCRPENGPTSFPLEGGDELRSAEN